MTVVRLYITKKIDCSTGNIPPWCGRLLLWQCYIQNWGVIKFWVFCVLWYTFSDIFTVHNVITGFKNCCWCAPFSVFFS